MDPEDPSGEEGWTDSKFKELCFHCFFNDDEQQGQAVPTSDVLTGSKPASSENSCRLYDPRKVETEKFY